MDEDLLKRVIVLAGLKTLNDLPKSQAGQAIRDLFDNLSNKPSTEEVDSIIEQAREILAHEKQATLGGLVWRPLTENEIERLLEACQNMII